MFFMNNKYIKLGVTIDDLDAVTNDLENLLHIQFAKHDSSYWGIYNKVMLSDSEEMRLGFNFVDEDWREEEHKDCPLILELNRLKQPEKMVKFLCEHLPYLIPLKMKDFKQADK
ncbi:hypothetical protein H1Z61_05280 [Bacillus aquiflavi]|uniref:Uncharacterized protein n=1 Tax=Bacillus aquiflavi TaxID=2672567 RepID=A0A6B3VYU9_9BACI|nr:hypothetical protein [Bacillus aquiflavi]MBA4536576.1 hypothetical protein [Bacillus aquiflavi]NEY80943.1 hypothetical protein [Bacillus aquiflavi]UAC49658.1 hypothetical protein K6959_07610 [Bacillus aquiflavi]